MNYWPLLADFGIGQVIFCRASQNLHIHKSVTMQWYVKIIILFTNAVQTKKRLYILQTTVNITLRVCLSANQCCAGKMVTDYPDHNQQWIQASSVRQVQPQGWPALLWVPRCVAASPRWGLCRGNYGEVLACLEQGKECGLPPSWRSPEAQWTPHLLQLG